MKNNAIERMYLARNLFRQGVASCSKKQDNFEFSKGILSLQDAVELALGAAATKVNAHLPKKIWFGGYFDEINKRLSKTDPKLPYERELLQLNDARVKIKHFGILQRPEDHDVAVNAVHPFLDFISKQFFNVEFDNVSLTDAIKKIEVRELLKQAEEHLLGKRMKGCVTTLAQAKFKIVGFRFMHSPLMRVFMSKDADPDPLDWEEFDYGRHEIWLLEHGIDVTAYHRFTQFLPEIGWDHEKKELVFWWEETNCHEGNWTAPNLQWCIAFLIDMALKVESDHGYPKVISDIGYFNFHVTSVKDDAIFWNYVKDKKSKELIHFKKTPIGPQVEVFRLAKGQTIIGYASRQKENPEWWFVRSPQIPNKIGKGEGYGYIASADVEITGVPKRVE